MTDKSGRVLYTFDKDSKNKSNCIGGCLSAWPPFSATASARPTGDFSLIQRDDGSMQWAFRHQPLYYFSGDSKAGEANGDQPSGLWHAVRPATKPVTTAAMPSAYGALGTTYND